MMERQLASIQKIVDLQPIAGADRIEVAFVLGWQCVVKKGEFNVGDLCVYFEIDSQLPPHKAFDFMADRKYRVRTIKLRKQIAQGLALPISVLTHFSSKLLNKYKEGDDVTTLIGVTKYEPRPDNVDPSSKKKLKPVVNYLMDYFWFRKLYNIIMPGKTKGNFPEFINKTDETRIQSCPILLRKNIGKSFYFTEKLDGSSASYFFNTALVGKKLGLFNKDKGNGFGVCSRNLRLVTPDNRYWWKYAKDHELEDKITCMSKYLGFSIAVQGELIGPGIQKNKYCLDDLDFYCFNIFNIDDKVYVSIEKKEEVCKLFGIKTVPRDDTVVVLTEDHDVNFFVNLSKRKSKLNKKVTAEGIVGRCTDDDTISFKVINPEWLLKNDE